MGLQDETGYLWFATENGLARFDGYRYVLFTHDADDVATISHDDVVSIVLSGDALWVGTWGGGLDRFNLTTGKVRRFSDGPGREDAFPGNHIQCMHATPDGALWVSTRQAGLFYLSPETRDDPVFLSISPKVEGDRGPGQIWAMASASNGIWIGADGGLFHLTSKDAPWRRIAPEVAPADWSGRRVTALLPGEDHLWIGTDQGLYWYDLRSGQLEARDPDGGKRNQVNTIHRDQRNVVWVGFAGGGLSRTADRGTFEHVRLGDGSGLPDDDVRYIFGDRSNLVWICTRDGILASIDRKPRKFTVYETQQRVAAIFLDGRDNVWAATSGGLDFLDRASGVTTTYRHDPNDVDSLSDDHATALAQTSAGTLWVGTERGLNQWSPEGFTRHFDGAVEGEPAIWVTGLIDDGPNRLLVGTRSGLLDWEGTRKQWYKHDFRDSGSLAGDHVTTMLIDSEDVLWIGTLGRGLDRLSPGSNRFEHFTHDPNNPGTIGNDSVLDLNESLGFIWVATEGGGLSRYNRGTGRFKRFGIAEGLPGDPILAITDDGDTLWLSTSRSLVRFLPESGIVRIFDVGVDPTRLRFSPGVVHNGGQGELFFGGNQGMVSFFPRLVQDNPYPPSSVIASIQLPGNKPLTYWPQDPFVLNHHDRVISLALSSLDFTMPAKNQFRYRLDPHDSDWIESEGATLVTYADLDPGRYQFRVLGSNNDGLWSREETVLAIRVRPSWLNTWWAYLFYVLFLLLAVRITLILLSTARERQLRQVREARESKLREEADENKRGFLASVSHEMRTPLTSIIGYAELIEEDVKENALGAKAREVQSDLSKIKAAAYHQLALVSNIIELGKLETGPEPLVLSSFDVAGEVSSLLVELKPQFEESDNRFRFEVPETVGAMRADRVKLLAVLRNFLVYANGRLQGGQIRMIIRKRTTYRESGRDSREWITFSIEDNGPGMPREVIRLFDKDAGDHRKLHRTSGSALGLELAQHFIKWMGGNISVDSMKKDGTIVIIQVPVLVTSINQAATF